MPREAVLEEVYHYRFRRPEAWALQRVYRPERSPLGAPRDAVWAVRDGEVVVVTDGYHPFAATDADDAYYLNALAGDRRTMACSFDPALDHVRERWSGEAPDPRLPLVGRSG
jgi:5-deoxy-glucuronate isomerase